MLTQDEMNAIKMRMDTASGYSTVGEVVADVLALWKHQRSQADLIDELETQIVFDKEVAPDLLRKRVTMLETHKTILEKKCHEFYDLLGRAVAEKKVLESKLEDCKEQKEELHSDWIAWSENDN